MDNETLIYCFSYNNLPIPKQLLERSHNLIFLLRNVAHMHLSPYSAARKRNKAWCSEHCSHWWKHALCLCNESFHRTSLISWDFRTFWNSFIFPLLLIHDSLRVHSLQRDFVLFRLHHVRREHGVKVRDRCSQHDPMSVDHCIVHLRRKNPSKDIKFYSVYPLPRRISFRRMLIFRISSFETIYFILSTNYPPSDPWNVC
jgi:hypothetical protein